MYNISLITIEIFHWYNIHYQFSSNGYSSLLVVNCKSDIIVGLYVLSGQISRITGETMK